jgi:uncharacterized membrane protein
VIAVVDMNRLPDPLYLCRLGGECITAALTGGSYFMGDSQAAPVFHLRLVFGPVLSLLAAYLTVRWHVVTVAVTALSVIVVGIPQLLGPYALLPLHPLVVFANLITLIAIGGHAGAALGGQSLRGADHIP